MASRAIEKEQKLDPIEVSAPFDSATGDLPPLNEDQIARETRRQQVLELSKELKNIVKGTDNSLYEDFCFKLIETTFQEFDAEPKQKVREFDYEDGSGGNERDVTIRLHLLDNFPRESHFWDYIKQTPNDTNNGGYCAKNLVFECKNNELRRELNHNGTAEHKGEIIDKYIYQLYRYLGPKNKYGILMCRNRKLSRHAIRAISRIRSDEYFILVIDDNDLFAKKGENNRKYDGWFETWINHGSVEAFFSNHHDQQVNSFRSEYVDQAVAEELGV